MELKEALLKRRSIRKFESTPVPDELIDELMHAAMSGPSACNKRPWEFYVVTGKAHLNKLQTASRFMGFDAPLAVIVCGNLRHTLPLKFSEYWIQDCSAATETIRLRATDLGLGAVWCGIHPQKRAEKRVKEILNLEDKLIPLNIIWIGHPAEAPDPRTQYDSKRVHYIK